MNCSNCGNQNMQGASFCSNCGSPLTDSTQDAQNQYHYQPRKTSRPPVRSNQANGQPVRTPMAAQTQQPWTTAQHHQPQNTAQPQQPQSQSIVPPYQPQNTSHPRQHQHVNAPYQPQATAPRIQPQPPMHHQPQPIYQQPTQNHHFQQQVVPSMKGQQPGVFVSGAFVAAPGSGLIKVSGIILIILGAIGILTVMLTALYMLVLGILGVTRHNRPDKSTAIKVLSIIALILIPIVTVIDIFISIASIFFILFIPYYIIAAILGFIFAILCLVGSIRNGKAYNDYLNGYYP